MNENLAAHRVHATRLWTTRSEAERRKAKRVAGPKRPVPSAGAFKKRSCRVQARDQKLI